MARVSKQPLFRGVNWVNTFLPNSLFETTSNVSYLKRPYRAPELLFGTRTYDPLAIDLWSLGATFVQFFTPLRLCSDGDDDDDTETDTLDNAPLTPFIVPKNLEIGYPGAQWTRDSLFNGERGEIGLAWSIFKIFGTPTADSWPVSDTFFFIFLDTAYL